MEDFKSDPQGEPIPSPSDHTHNPNDPPATRPSTGGAAEPPYVAKLAFKKAIISPEMRELLGGFDSYDPFKQQKLEKVMAQLFREFGVDSILQGRLAEQFAIVVEEKVDLQHVITTTVQLSLPRAARDILDPGWSNFYPPDKHCKKTDGTVNTAYGQFLQENDYGFLSEPELLDAAKAKLATLGLPERALRDHAYVLALPTIEALKRQQSSLTLEAEGILKNLLKLQAIRASKRPERES